MVSKYKVESSVDAFRFRDAFSSSFDMIRSLKT